MSACDQAEIAFDLDEKLYPLEAVQNAIYVFTDRAYVRVERCAPERLQVVMTLKAGAAPSAQSALKGEFDNELIHQILRQRVSDSNQKIREYIVTKALVSALPSSPAAGSSPVAAPGEAPCPECVEAEGAPPAPPQIDAALEKEIDRLLAEIESGDGAADPLGVSVPWEEAFGAKSGSPKKTISVPDKTKAPAKATVSSKSRASARVKAPAKEKRS
ncbi:MAG: His-Xaa-Ser system protein HxsD [Elusimicrobiota bacterium]